MGKKLYLGSELICLSPESCISSVGSSIVVEMSLGKWRGGGTAGICVWGWREKDRRGYTDSEL